jgi:hypothetical protein
MAATVLSAQQAPPKSPPATASATIGGKNITITYSSPRVNGRAGQLFGKDGRISKDPHYPVWRGGANAATKLHSDGDLDIGGLTVPKGDYTLFFDISDPDNWVPHREQADRPVGACTYDPAQESGNRQNDHGCCARGWLRIFATT